MKEKGKFVTHKERISWLKSLTPAQRKEVETKGYYVKDKQ